MVEIEAVEDPKLWPTLPSLVERRTDEILTICQRAKVRGTFFVLGWVAERYPAMVRRIADEGHELATHSYWHRKVYSLTPEVFLEDMRRSIDVIESIGIRVRGFRAPSFQNYGTEWAFDVLHERFLTLTVPRRTGPRWRCNAPFRLMSLATPSGRPCLRNVGIMSIGPKGLLLRGDTFDSSRVAHSAGWINWQTRDPNGGVPAPSRFCA